MSLSHIVDPVVELELSLIFCSFISDDFYTHVIAYQIY